MELVFRSEGERRLFRAIQRMCLSHGVVMGLFGLAVEDLGHDYSTDYCRVRRMEARGQLTVEHPGHGRRPMTISIPDHLLTARVDP